MSQKNKRNSNPNVSKSASSQVTNSLAGFPKFKNHALWFLFIVSIALYLNTLNNGYAFDDSVAITDNSFTQQGLKGVPDLLTKDFFEGIYGHALELGGGRYRPLSLVMFAIEYELFGQNPMIGHLMNIILYAILVCVLFLTLIEVFPNYVFLSFITTFLFAIHPVHTEVVANIKSRDEILSFLGAILCLFWLFKSIRLNQKKYLWYSVVAYFLSLLSKENAITFLVIIPLALYLFSTLDRKGIIARTLPFIIAGITYVLIRTALVGMIGDRENNDIMENPYVAATVVEKYATIMRVLGKYLWIQIFPKTLSSDYSFNEIPYVTFASPFAFVPLLIHVGLFVWAVKQVLSKKNPILNIVAFGILFYMATISLVSNIVFNIGAPMGERFLFLPSLGFCLVICTIIVKMFKQPFDISPSFKNTIFYLFAGIGILFSVKIYSRNKDWENNETLFAADVVNAPNSAKAHYYYGNTLLNNALKEKDLSLKNKKLNISKTHTIKAAQINPKFHHAFYNLGSIYNELGNADSAIVCLNEVLKLQPTHIATQGLLGSVYGKMKGDFDKAIFYLSKAVFYNPKDGNSYENLGIAYAMKGDIKNAIPTFEKAMQLKPPNAQTYMNLGVLYLQAGDKAKSEEYLNKAFELDPSLRKQK